MSEMIRGGEDRFAAAQKRVQLAVDAATEEAARLMQAEVVSRVPVRTGNLRNCFASGEAVGRLQKTGAWRFGLITAELRKKAHYAWFVEYGTKGYGKGETRVTRVGKGGKVRTKKVRRRVGAHRAQPFFRPGIEAARAKATAIIVEGARGAILGDSRAIIQVEKPMPIVQQILGIHPQ